MRFLVGAGWRAPLPGQPCRPQGPLHVHILALKVHQDDAEVRVSCAGVQLGHVRQELGHPARLVLHWRRMGPLSPPDLTLWYPVWGQWRSRPFP